MTRLPARRCAALVAALGCPGLVTYKAKGVVPDADPLFGGVFTGGEAEAPILAEADCILLAGADPVEFIPQPWRFAAPVIELGTAPRPLTYRSPAAAIHGPLAPALAALGEGAGRSGWTAGDIAAHRDRWLAVLANAPGGNRGCRPRRWWNWRRPPAGGPGPIRASRSMPGRICSPAPASGRPAGRATC